MVIKSVNVEEHSWEYFRELVEEKFRRNGCSQIVSILIKAVTQGLVQIDSDGSVDILSQLKLMPDGDIFELGDRSALVVSNSERFTSVELEKSQEAQELQEPDINQEMLQELLRVLQSQKSEVEAQRITIQKQEKLIQEFQANLNSLEYLQQQQQQQQQHKIKPVQIELPQLKPASETEIPIVPTQVHSLVPYLDGDLTEKEFHIELSEDYTDVIIETHVSQVKPWMMWDGVMVDITVDGGVPMLPMTESIMMFKSVLRILEHAPAHDLEADLSNTFTKECLQRTVNDPSFMADEDFNRTLEKVVSIMSINGMR